MNKSFLLIICTVLFISFQSEAQVLKDRTGTSTSTTQTSESETTATPVETNTTSTESSSNNTSTASTYSQQIADKVTDIVSSKVNLSESQKNQFKNTGASWLDKLWTRVKNIKFKNPFKK